MGTRKGVMLAVPFEERRLFKWPKPWLCQPKINGNRCLAVCKDGNVTLLSSQGNKIVSVPHINKELASWKYEGVFDGELWVPGKKLQDIRSIVSRQNSLHPDYSQIVYSIFDIKVPWTAQKQRIATLALLVNLATPSVWIVPTFQALSLTDVHELLDMFLADGYEGIIVRNRDALYEEKRSTNIMKLKPSKTDTYEIIGVKEEKTIDGIPKGTLGAFICKGDGGIFSVGSGLTEVQRDHYWKRRDELKGKKLLVKYQELTKDGIPFHPVVLSLLESGDTE